MPSVSGGVTLAVHLPVRCCHCVFSFYGSRGWGAYARVQWELVFNLFSFAS